MRANTETATIAGASGPAGPADGRGGPRGWFGGRRVLVAAAAIAAVAAALAFAGAGTAERLLPLLFVLPCMAMMFMCMRHAGGQRQEPDKSGVKTDDQ